MQISRIRLTDKTLRLRPRLVAPAQTGKTEVPVKVREWIRPALASPDLMLVAQPPTQPRCRVAVDRTVGTTDGSCGQIRAAMRQLAVVQQLTAAAGVGTVNGRGDTGCLSSRYTS